MNRMFSTRAKPHQMLKRERERLTQLLSKWLVDVLKARTRATKWEERPDGTRHELEWEYEIDTKAGPLRVCPMGWWLACRFLDLDKAKQHVPHGFNTRLNPNSGKWNFFYGRVTGREACNDFIAELHDLVFYWDRHDLSCCGHEVLVDEWHGERGTREFFPTVNGHPIESNHPDFEKMIMGAVQASQAAPLLDWLQEFAPEEWVAAQPQPRAEGAGQGKPKRVRVRGVSHYLVPADEMDCTKAERTILGIHPLGSVYLREGHGYVASGCNWLRFLATTTNLTKLTK